MLLSAWLLSFTQGQESTDDLFLSFTVDAKFKDVKLYWKNDNNEFFLSIKSLKQWLESKGEKLLFAMNAGMYRQNHYPQGLFVENGIERTPLDTSSGNGNFYLKPNGVFYITSDNTPGICKTNDYKNIGNVKYATQSGPMLVIDSEIHSAFKRGSTNLNIRNGVGVLPNHTILFALSKKEVSLYDFADYFKRKGCRYALYLDGFVSRMYLPEKKWIQTDGDFGVIIGVTAETK